LTEVFYAFVNSSAFFAEFANFLQTFVTQLFCLLRFGCISWSKALDDGQLLFELSFGNFFIENSA